MTEYCPALVEMGIQVRQCYWKMQAAGTGDVARVLLRDAIVLLQSLHATGNTEYVRNLVVMDLMWSDLHSGLPACGFVEEALESSLGQLARRAGTDTRAHTVQDFSDLYTHGIPVRESCGWEQGKAAYMHYLPQHTCVPYLRRIGVPAPT